MTLLWIPFTIMAAFMQSWRNALQKQLRQHTSTLGVTLARFLFALPLSAVYLLALHTYFPTANIPTFNAGFFGYILIAALAQITATALMVTLFKTRNYAIGVGLAKSEAVIAAILGAIFFGAHLSPLAWIGVGIGGIAVWLMSLAHTKSRDNDTTVNSTDNNIAINNCDKSKSSSLRTVSIGLGSGLFFALCSLYIRESALMLQDSLTMSDYSFLVSAGWVLFFVLLIQTLLLTLWLLYKEPQTLKQLYQHKKLTVSVSVFSFMGSIGWFTAMSLQTVAMVKILGQVEVIFTLAISAWWFKENLGRNDYLGLGLIVLGAVLVIMA